MIIYRSSTVLISVTVGSSSAKTVKERAPANNSTAKTTANTFLNINILLKSRKIKNAQPKPRAKNTGSIVAKQ